MNERILAVADAFDELHALVLSEPALSEFVPATAELCNLARLVRAGQPVALTVPSDSSARVPTRELAELIVAIVKRTPGPLGHEEPDVVRTMTILHGNLVRAIVHAIFLDYSDLMRT
jgi:hypothetical protein